MIWLTWRQFRAQAVAAAAALAAIAVILEVTGPNLAHMYATGGLAGCRANCTSLASTFLSQMRSDAVYPLACTSRVARPFTSRPRSSASSGARRWLPGSWKRALSGWLGTRASPGPAGWRPSSP